ncbi:MAG: hypothetical protein KGL39_16860 [Patescibacteria group bacterium]|nr:hypothetical protein [Patescibacteria group bacterium]
MKSLGNGWKRAQEAAQRVRMENLRVYCQQQQLDALVRSMNRESQKMLIGSSGPKKQETQLITNQNPYTVGHEIKKSLWQRIKAKLCTASAATSL